MVPKWILSKFSLFTSPSILFIQFRLKNGADLSKLMANVKIKNLKFWIAYNQAMCAGNQRQE